MNSGATFDLEPVTVAARQPWFDEHADTGPYRLLVATRGSDVIG